MMIPLLFMSSLAPSSPPITWHNGSLLTDLQQSPVMVAAGGAPRVSWGFSVPNGGTHTANASTQTSWRLTLAFQNGSTAFDSGDHRSDAQHAELPIPSNCDACILWWRVCVRTSKGATGCAPSQQIFTSSLEALARVEAFWAPDNATAVGPQFAFFRAAVVPRRHGLSSALVFITADGPGCENVADKGNRKLLGGYKLWLGGTLLGIGPGRSKCDTLGAARAPTLCPNGVETVYDGYDITQQLAACAGQSGDELERGGEDGGGGGGGGCELFIESYAFDQPAFNVTRRILVSVRMRYSDGTLDAPLDSPGAWESYDADAVYLGRLWEAGGGGHITTQRASSGGGAWYYAPHEYLDMSQMPVGTPLSYPGVGARAHGTWRPAVAKRAFRNLIVRRTPPVALSYVDAKVVARGGDRFSFDVGREVQGGVMLDAGALAATCNVTVVFGEELQANGSVLSPMRTGSLYRDSWALSPTSSSASGAAARVQHHEYLEGRFGELTFECEEPEPPPLMPRVRMWVVHGRDLNKPAARMNSSSAELNAVWDLCQRTSRATSLDLFSDSNARQRSADCMADDNTAFRLAYATSAELALQRYAMLQALTVCGSLAKPGAGAGAQSCRTEWTVLPLIMARDDALHTGDLSFVRAHYDGLVASALGGLIDPTVGLVRSDEVLIDWPPGQRDSYVLSVFNSVANAFAYRGLRALVEIAGWLDRPADAAKHAVTAAALKQVINRKMWNGTAFCDGICSNVSHTAFHSTMYLLAFGAVDDAHRPAAWQYLRRRIDPPFGRSPPGAPPPPPPPPRASLSPSSRSAWPPPPPAGARLGMPCSSYAAQFALEALYVGNEADHGASALQVLTSDAKHTWRHMMARGATATMEAWDTDEKPNLTWSHVWSASPGFLIPWLLFGLRCLTPGCSELRVQPAVGSLREASYTLPTVKGPVEVRVTQDALHASTAAEGSHVEVALVLPVGIDASVALARGAGAKATTPTSPADDRIGGGRGDDTRARPVAGPALVLVNGATWGSVRSEGAHLVAFGLRGGGEHVIRIG